MVYKVLPEALRKMERDNMSQSLNNNTKWFADLYRNKIVTIQLS